MQGIRHAEVAAEKRTFEAKAAAALEMAAGHLREAAAQHRAELEAIDKAAAKKPASQAAHLREAREAVARHKTELGATADKAAWEL